MRRLEYIASINASMKALISSQAVGWCVYQTDDGNWVKEVNPDAQKVVEYMRGLGITTYCYMGLHSFKASEGTVYVLYQL